MEIENYLPIIVKKKKWSDRVKEIMGASYERYIFIKSDERERLKALEQISISKCLFDQGRPAIIPPWQMENLKRILQVKSEFFVYEGLVAGQK